MRMRVSVVRHRVRVLMRRVLMRVLMRCVLMQMMVRRMRVLPAGVNPHLSRLIERHRSSQPENERQR